MKALHGAGLAFATESIRCPTGWKSGGRMYCSLDGSVGNFVNGFVLV